MIYDDLAYSNRHEADVDRLKRENAELRAKIADYENRITWDTTCGNCARLLDASYRDYCRAEAAEEQVKRLEKQAERDHRGYSESRKTLKWYIEQLEKRLGHR